MSFEETAKRIDPEIYARFKKALELGKWPDGRPLTPEQKEICLQAVMIYEAGRGVPEVERVGYIDRSRKKPRSGDNDDSGDVDTVRVLH